MTVELMFPKENTLALNIVCQKG